MAYQEIIDEGKIQRIRRRFGKQMQQMRTLGFVDEFYVAEIVSPWATFLLFPVVLYSCFYLRDLLSLRRTLGIVVLNPYFIHKDVYSYSVIESRGVYYTTVFTDGLILQTVSFHSFFNRSNSQYKLLREECKEEGIAETWTLHQSRVRHWVNRGCETISFHTSKDVLCIEDRIGEIESGSAPTSWPGSHDKVKSEA